MNKVKTWFYSDQKYLPPLILLFVVAIGTLTYRLSTLLGGFSSSEDFFTNSSKNISNIVIDPSNFEFKLAQWLLHQTGHHGILAMRGVAATFGLLTAALLYYILRHMHSRRVSIITLFSLICSAWFLGIARNATDNIMVVFATSLSLACLLWLQRKKENNPKNKKILIMGCLFILTFYTPVVFVLNFLFLCILRKQILTLLRSQQKKLLRICLLLWAVLILPLVARSFSSITFSKKLIGLDEQIPSIGTIIKAIYHNIAAVFWHSQTLPEFHLATLAYIDAVGAVFLILGIYYYLVRHFNQLRSRLIVLSSLLALGLAALRPWNDSGSIFLIFIFIVISAGITVLLQQWFTVFPKNPIARSVGVSIVIAIVSLSCLFQLTKYFIAWPHNEQVKSVFNITKNY